MQSRIYTYKITFEEVPYYYYGSHKEKKYNEYYMGSPVTHKWCWSFYTPKKQILEFFNTREEANFVENRLIKPVLDDPYCLNENCGGIVSTEMCKKGIIKQIKNNIGLYSRTKDQIKDHQNKGRETQKILGVGIYGLSKETRKKNGERLGKRNVETGYIQKIGKKQGKFCYENNLGIFGLSKEERRENSSKGGKISANEAYKNKTGIHSFTLEQRKDASSKAGQKNVETGHIQNLGKNQIKKINSKLWKCLITGHITTSGPLTNYQKSRGIDTSLRVEVDSLNNKNINE
jgi:hypothetical protein